MSRGTAAGICFLLFASGAVKGQDEDDLEYPPYDGWYNNFAHPDWGASDTPLLRLLPHAYSDGVYAPSGVNRPNPIEISQIVFNGSTGMGSHRNRTALLVFFGQQLVEEVLDSQASGCPPEYFNIPIPSGHPEFDPLGKGGRVIPLLRTRYDQRTGFSPNVPREQLNGISAYFDGSLIYGPHKTWANSLRRFKDGLLRATNETNGTIDSKKNFPAVNDIRLPFANPPPPRDHYLKPIRRFFTIGNPRGNENPFLLTFGILWFRYHNFRAHQLKTAHPTWSDEKLFNKARSWTIAVHQKIVMYDWLPSWLGEDRATMFPPYKYSQNVHPQIANVFQSAAMRFGHTLVPPAVYRRDASCNFKNSTMQTKAANKTALRTCNTYWNPQEAIRESDIDEILMGMMSQIAEREDNIITPDLRGNVFGPLEFSRRDLMAVNIQRGRDHGLPDYNTAREFFGLPRIRNISEVNPKLYAENPELFADLIRLYNNSLNDLDIWPLGMLETTEQGPGPLFRTIIKDQFLRIRDGDRFWFENYKQTKLFTDAEIAEINRTTLRDIIHAVTEIPRNATNENVFFHRAGDPCPQPAQLSHLNPNHMEDCTKVETFDYFSGSEVSYALSIAALLATLFPISGVLLYLAKRHKADVAHEQAVLRTYSKRMSAKKPENANVVSVSAAEWLGEKEGEQNVIVEMNVKKMLIEVKLNGNELVRSIDMTHVQGSGQVEIHLSADAHLRMVLVKIPKEYDLVLNFESIHERQEFTNKLRDFLNAVGGIPLGSPTVTSEKLIKKTAVTKAQRQKVLETFFSEIFAHALKYEKVHSSRQSVSFQQASDLVSCELTKAEFAEALSLRAGSLFVTNMFNLVDANDNGYISFREFLDFFVIFSKGTAQDKAKLLFDMHDLRKTGTLSKEEFKMMLRSMVELSNEKIEESQINGLIDNLFRQAKIDDKQSGISLEDFKTIMHDYQDELNYASLNVQIGDLKAPEMKGLRRNATFKARQSIRRAYSNDETTPTVSRQSKMDAIRPIEMSAPASPAAERWASVLRFFEIYRRQIFWLSLYTLAAGIYVLRAYFVHIIGHCINLYHISTQTPSDLACIFRSFFHSSDALPKFHRWCWETITGLTGVALTIHMFIIYIFGIQFARRHTYKGFWYTHNTYPIFFVLMILHGAGRLVQGPLNHYFFLGPIILFTLDQLVSISRKKIEIAVVKAELLPSDVTYLEFRKPQNFKYRSGQWVRIACLARSENEYHPFTLTSAPHEHNLSLHIRACGPWTIGIRKLYDPRVLMEHPLPKVFLDGPYGEGHQDWCKYEVSILVGGGIGVTPFASILKDIAHKSQTGVEIDCKKVYFIWVTRTQRHFEWMTDIIREVESKDTRGIVSVHIFITQFKEKFDIRTTMLYICERYFQKISDCSLFTGLKSITHFGRPDFDQFLRAIRTEHSDTNFFGVFSCGPPPMTRNVERACSNENQQSDGDALFVHHYENF